MTADHQQCESGGRGPGDGAPQEQHAVVVGASSGMGAAIVETLRAQGIKTLALDLPSASWGDEVAGMTGPVDVTDVASVESALKGAEEAFGALEIVVNCAGILGPVAPTVETSQETFERIVDLNLGVRSR